VKYSGDEISVFTPPTPSSELGMELGMVLPKECAVVPNETVSLATIAIMTIAEINAAVEAFERGEISVFDALAAVGTAWEAYEGRVPARRQAA
jgi:hypothetical protein